MIVASLVVALAGIAWFFLARNYSASVQLTRYAWVGWVAFALGVVGMLATLQWGHP